MRTYLIGYDLNRPRGVDDYPDLIKAIKDNFGTWWHHLDSTWIVKSDLNAGQIRDLFTKHIDGGDELLVVRLTGNWATLGFSERAINWLKENMSYE